jgi:DNA-directed RNA polymerase
LGTGREGPGICRLNGGEGKAGVFWSNAVKARLVRTRRRAQLDEMDKRLMEGTAEPFRVAVNAVQATPWRINPTMLETFTTLWQRDIRAGGLPSREPAPIPSKDGIEKMTKAEQAALLKRISDTLANERHELPKRKAVQIIADQALAIQADPLRREAFWFGWNADYRGRLLTLQTGLQPQGNKLAKSLLDFPEGKTIDTQEAEDWLAIHFANEWGHDKLPFQERIQWAHDNAEVALRILRNPTRTVGLWGGVGNVEKLEGWMALRAALEWGAYLLHGRGFVSHIPVAIDGTCNGLQHLAAMARDTVCGERVNICGTGRGDVYRKVADDAADKLRHSVQWGTYGDKSVTEDQRKWAGDLLAFGISRNDAKKPTMTIPYGASMRTCLQDIEAGFVAQIKAGKKASPWGDDLRDGKGLRAWGAKVVFDQVRENVGEAMKVMEWLESCTYPFSRALMPMSWATPSGFWVHQEIRETLDPEHPEGRVRGKDAARRNVEVKIDIEIPDSIDAGKQAQKMPPNYVHSYDAAHLALTHRAASREGVTHFAPVHDSFATHVADMAKLHRITMETFQAIYSVDVSAEQWSAWVNALGDPLHQGIEPPPARGDWDPTAPMNPYFFS